MGMDLAEPWQLSLVTPAPRAARREAKLAEDRPLQTGDGFSWAEIPARHAIHVARLEYAYGLDRYANARHIVTILITTITVPPTETHSTLSAATTAAASPLAAG